MIRRRVSRRRMLGLMGGAGVVVAGGLGATALRGGATSTGEFLRSEVPLPRPFQAPLPIPPVLRATGHADGKDHYAIRQREATAEILPGVQTPIWGYDGIFPGPTIESRRGRPVVVHHTNELPVPTVVHLHGGRTPPASDGYPTDLVLPKTGWHEGHSHGGHDMHDPDAVVTQGTRTYEFPLDQPATMLWYHDHRMDFTGPAIYRGLAGLHIVRDDVEDSLPLPRDDRELPLVLTDRAFSSDGSFRYPSIDPELREPPGVREEYVEGVLGDVILVNGAPWPVHDVAAVVHRLRFLNASNARRYELELDPPPPDGPSFVQIGTDQGLLDAPRSHETVRMAPAERYDVVVDFGRYPIGTEVTLRNRLGSEGTRDVMRFRVARRDKETSHLPDRLADIEPLHRDQATVTREFAFNAGMIGDHHGWLIGHQAYDPQRIDASPQLGEVEIWKFVADVHHPVHLHLVGFQVLTRGGRDPDALDAGRKDTVDLRPGEGVEVIARFDGYRGRYVFHCHNAEHEDMGMMANFEVV